MPFQNEKSPLLGSNSQTKCSSPPPDASPARSDTLFHKKSTRLAGICLVILVIYTTVSVIFYKNAESLSTFKALYFCVITFTTVGFGDFKPSSNESKIFTCLFVFCGLAVIASVIAYILEYLVEEREANRKYAIHKNFDVEDDVDVNTLVNMEPIDRHSHDQKNAAPITIIPPYILEILSGMAHSSLKIIGIVGVGTLCYMYVFDNHSAVDALYLACMTVSTVGYGDIAPTNDMSRGFTIVYALVGTTLTAGALSSFTGALSALCKAKVEEEVMNATLNLENLAQMDSDRNNVVTKDEFVLYKLKVMGLVDNDVIQRAEAQFRKLDITGNGVLTAEDVVAFQEKVNAAKSTILRRQNMQ
jgi:potassium channel subfamily K, other eukaryote